MNRFIYVAITAILVLGAWMVGSNQAQEADDGLYRVEIDSGMNPPYWLEMSQYDQWTRMALVFGWFDDQEGCEEWANWQREEYFERDGRDYRCVIAD